MSQTTMRITTARPSPSQTQIGTLRRRLPTPAHERKSAILWTMKLRICSSNDGPARSPE